MSEASNMGGGSRYRFFLLRRTRSHSRYRLVRGLESRTFRRSIHHIRRPPAPEPDPAVRSSCAERKRQVESVWRMAIRADQTKRGPGVGSRSSLFERLK